MQCRCQCITVVQKLAAWKDGEYESGKAANQAWPTLHCIGDIANKHLALHYYATCTTASTNCPGVRLYQLSLCFPLFNSGYIFCESLAVPFFL